MRWWTLQPLKEEAGHAWITEDGWAAPEKGRRDLGLGSRLGLGLTAAAGESCQTRKAEEAHISPSSTPTARTAQGSGCRESQVTGKMMGASCDKVPETNGLKGGRVYFGSHLQRFRPMLTWPWHFGEAACDGWCVC